MKFIRKLFGLEKQPVVTPDAWGSKDVANESKAVSINEQSIAPAITQVAQATKAVEILIAKEELSAPAKVAPVKKSTPKKQPVKKAPAKK